MRDQVASFATPFYFPSNGRRSRNHHDSTRIEPALTDSRNEQPAKATTAVGGLETGQNYYNGGGGERERHSYHIVEKLLVQVVSQISLSKQRENDQYRENNKKRRALPRNPQSRMSNILHLYKEMTYFTQHFGLIRESCCNSRDLSLE